MKGAGLLIDRICSLESKLDNFELSDSQMNSIIEKVVAGHSHSNYVSSISNNGSGNAITSITIDGNIMTVNSDKEFALKNHSHSNYISTIVDNDSGIISGFSIDGNSLNVSRKSIISNNTAVTITGSLCLDAVQNNPNVEDTLAYKIKQLNETIESIKDSYLPLTGGTLTGNIVNKKPIQALSIEFNQTSNLGHGGFIDFHYNGSTSDYTSRIIEGVEGELQFLANMICTKTFSCPAIYAQLFRPSSKTIRASICAEKTAILTYDTSAYAPLECSALTQTSTKLAKENVKDITEDEALTLLKLNIKKFDYRKEFGGAKDNYGLIAEDCINIVPEAVFIPDEYDESNFDLSKGIKNDTISMDYTKLIPKMIKLLQMQQKEIEYLKSLL